MSASGEESPRGVATAALVAICEDDALRATAPQAVVIAAKELLQEQRWADEERSDAQWRQELLLDAVEAAQAAAREQVLEMMASAPARVSGRRPPLD